MPSPNSLIVISWFQTFAPLSSGEYSFSNACEEWGVKWDFEIGNVIETGIKEVQPLPSQEGNKDWGIYYHKKGNRVDN